MHDVESELHQKILVVDKLPGTTLIGNITIIISATAVKKIFLDLHSKAKQLIYAVKESLEV